MLKVFAFDPSDAADAVKEILQGTEGLGVETTNINITSINEL